MRKIISKPSKVIVPTPRKGGCCRNASLLKIASQLRKEGQEKNASKLEDLVGDLLDLRQAQDQLEPMSGIIKGAPARMDRFFSSCMSKWGDDEEKCKRWSLDFFCRNVDPNHGICRKQ